MSNLNKSLSNPLDKELQCDALFLKAELYFNQKKYSDAIIEYGKYLQITTPSEQYADEVNPFKARYGQAYCYLMAKQYGAAIPPLKDALNMSNHLKKNKSNSALINDVYFRLGDAYYMTKDFDNALSAYQHVLDNSDKNLDYALFQKGMILGFKNEDAAKVSILQNLISRYPESALADDALYEKGITYQQDLQDVESAISTFTALVNNYPNANHRAGALLRLGLINYNLNHADKALSYYQQAVKEFPKTDEAKEALSTMQEIYVSLGKPEQYVQYLNQNGLEVSASTQDSLYFNSAEEKYINGEYADAIPGLETYLSKFPNGYFHLEANYFAGDAYMRIKKYEDALKRFDAVIKEQPNTYAQRALKKAALISFEYLKDYSKSKEYYGMLYTYSIQKPEEFAMLMNALRSAYLAKADDDLLKYADLVIAHASAGKDDLLEAHYYKGSVLMDKNDIDKARLEFLEVSAGPTSEQNAEASYELAHILNLQGQFQPSNDEAFKMKDKVEGYDYWLAKLFILIGDNYHQLKDNYQAKATYESILNNYKGDATLIEECRKKLTELNNEALEKSKIELITAPSDSIIKTEEIK
jgi:TolA-binding protein